MNRSVGFIPLNKLYLHQIRTRLLPRSAGPDRNFRAARQVQIVATFNEDGTGAGADSDSGADGGAFTAAGDCADEGADRAADRRSRHCARSLAVVLLHISFPIYAHTLAIRERRAFNGSGEVICPAVLHSDALEIKRHSRPPRDASGAIRARDYAFDHRAPIPP